VSHSTGPIAAKLRRVIAGIPFAVSFHELLHESPGSWLFRRRTVAWLSDPALVRQLPRPYRLFARYCRSASYSPRIAELLLRSIIAIRCRIASNDDIVPLAASDTATVFLDLRDPRFLRVPSELSALPSLLRNFLRSGDTFIDVGANHGAFSSVAARLVGNEGLVVAIEPQPRLAEVVRRGLKAAGGRFEVHQIVFGDRAQLLDFFVPLATSGSAGVLMRYSAVSRHRTIQVAMHRADEVIDASRLPGRVFIKVDVEGSEPAFLRGADRLIRAAAPVMLSEINPKALQAASSSKEELARQLVGLGYDRFVRCEELSLPRPLAELSDGDVIVFPAGQR
jgi:FkbM family methyltransferase